MSYDKHIPNPQLPSFIMDPTMISSASDSATVGSREPTCHLLPETADFDSIAMTRTGTVVFHASIPTNTS